MPCKTENGDTCSSAGQRSKGWASDCAGDRTLLGTPSCEGREEGDLLSCFLL